MGKGRHCYICGKDVELKGSMKDHQDEIHREDLAKIRISITMKDVVRTYCKVVNKETNQPCGENVKVNAMRTHTKNKHNMVITEYKNTYNQHYYDLIELIMHKCGICGEYVLLDSDEIAKHLKMRSPVNHDITHGNYNAKFMKLVGPSSVHKKPKLKAIALAPGLSEKSSNDCLQKSNAMAKPIPEKTKASKTKTSTTETKGAKFPPGPVPINRKPAQPQSVPFAGDEKENLNEQFQLGFASDEELLSRAPDPSVTVGSFRALLRSLDSDNFPELERLLNLNI